MKRERKVGQDSAATDGPPLEEVDPKALDGHVESSPKEELERKEKLVKERLLKMSGRGERWCV